MQIKAEEISSIIKEKIKGFDKQVDVNETGSVIQVGDGIAKVYGLDGAMAGEMLEFPGGLYGIALNLEEDNVGVVLMGDDVGIKEGDPVKRTGRIAEIPVGEALDRPGRECDRTADRREGTRSSRNFPPALRSSRRASLLGNRSANRCRPASRRSMA